MEIRVVDRRQLAPGAPGEEQIAPLPAGRRRRRIEPKRRTGTLAPPIPMEKFIIEGGASLSGTIVPVGNKNGALPILAACLLTTDEVILRNVPRIRDVEAMALLLEGLGARVEWRAPGEVLIDTSGVDPDSEVDRTLAERIRASFLLAGPLLARFGRAHMPPPGGDVIGRRRLDPHLDAFRALGAFV
jgi:UDP-N-acetylglucosamine 1-carboxyvinyltransferase